MSLYNPTQFEDLGHHSTFFCPHMQMTNLYMLMKLHHTPIFGITTLVPFLLDHTDHLYITNHLIIDQSPS